MMRLTYNHYSPPVQALQAIDLSTEVWFASVIDKQDGDRIFTANAVVNHFGEFQDVKRYTHDDWETLPRYPAEIQTDGTETLEAFPAYTDDVLYVARHGLTPHTPGVTPIEVSDDGGMESFPDPSRQGDFSSHSFYDSDPYNSNYNTMHSMADRWTLNQLDKDIRLQPSFFVLPKRTLPSTDKNDPSAVQLTMYLLCVNHHRTEYDSVPHFAGVPGVAVKRPAEFLGRFSATLLWSLKTLKDSLRVPETGLGDDQAGYAQIATLLQSELGLSSADDVKQLVVKMIEYLQELRQQDSNQVTGTRPPLSRHDIAVLPSYLERHPDTLQDDIFHRGLFHACDSQGREQLMCRSCYQLLYPLHSAKYIVKHVGAHGDYDAQKGSITFRPQDSEDLQQLCLLDAAMVGCVTELIIDVSWDAGTEDVQSIHALADRLGLTSLTIATTAIASFDATSAPSSPLSSLPDESLGSQLEKIKELSHALLQGLKHLCISSHVALNAPALLFDLRRLSPQKNALVVTVKEPSSRCLAGLYNGNTQLLDLRTTLDHAKNITTTGYFAGNLQSITITVLESLQMESPHLVLSLLTDGITKILRKNPNLYLLTLYCDARDFRMMEAMMESIYSNMTSDQAPDSRLSIYTLIDNSEDHLVATFKLPNSRDNKAVVANVTTRKKGSGHDAFLDEYGLFVRTLNTNDKFGTSAIDALHRSITRKRSSQLRNVTISVGDLDPEGAVTFLSILKYSNVTLKQLVLFGSPVDYQVYITVMDALRSLSSVEVVCFDDGSNMRQWIDDVQDSLLEGDSLTVLDRTEDLRRSVPGHDDTSLDWLRIRQAIHFNTGAAFEDASATSRLSSISLPVEVQQGYKPTEDQQLLRALGNLKSTINTTAPATDEIHEREEYEVLEDESCLIPFKKTPTDMFRAFELNQDFISSKGYRSVTDTPLIPLFPAITSNLVPATSQPLSPSSPLSNLKTLPAVPIARPMEMLLTTLDDQTCTVKDLSAPSDPNSANEVQRAPQSATTNLSAEKQLVLGNTYRDGKKVAQEHQAVMYWCFVAAEQQHAGAMYNVGDMYDLGKDVPQDFAMAMKWYLKAADQQHAVAQHNIGVMYDVGEGVPQDFANAMKWYLMAADQGDAFSQYRIGNLYNNGQSVPQDYVRAMNWFLKAANQGLAIAQFDVGRLYNNGQGVPQDFTEAAEWFSKAADGGLDKAKRVLEALKGKGVAVN